MLTKTKNCKRCFKNYIPCLIEEIFYDKSEFCLECLNKLENKIRYFKLCDCKCESLYDYENDYESKTVINLIKNKFDVELTNMFIIKYLLYLKIKFYNYTICFAPSSKSSFNNRGFDHLHEMFKLLNIKKLDCFIKTQDIEQKHLNKVERLNINKYIKLKIDKKELKNKRILLVDDVMTTGSTLKACLELLKTCECKKIRGLVLLKHI